MKKFFFRIFLAIIGFAICLFLLGPRAADIHLDPEIKPFPVPLDQLEKYILDQEAKLPAIKPGNEATLLWNDSSHQKTPYSLVYLHGFSASRGEGDPIHSEFARRYGMNAFLPRLDQHGIQEKDALLKMTAENLLESAKEAVAIGKMIGDRVIVMSCSTGSTLGLYLAAHNPEVIDALVCFSPNIDIKAAGSSMLDGPWGLQILKIVEGGNYHTWEAPEKALPFWTTSYRIEALIELRQLIDATMVPSTFSLIQQPIHMQYYYQSEEKQDQVVSVDAMLDMFDQLGTPSARRSKVAIPEAEQHVFVSKYYDCNLISVRKNLFNFAETTLEIPVVLQ